jgi:hypothetical protein
MKTSFDNAASVQMGSNTGIRETVQPRRQFGDDSKPAQSPYYPTSRRQMGYQISEPSRQMS